MSTPSFIVGDKTVQCLVCGNALISYRVREHALGDKHQRNLIEYALEPGALNVLQAEALLEPRVTEGRKKRRKRYHRQQAEATASPLSPEQPIALARAESPAAAEAAAAGGGAAVAGGGAGAAGGAAGAAGGGAGAAGGGAGAAGGVGAAAAAAPVAPPPPPPDKVELMNVWLAEQQSGSTADAAPPVESTNLEAARDEAVQPQTPQPPSTGVRVGVNRLRWRSR